MTIYTRAFVEEKFREYNHQELTTYSFLQKKGDVITLKDIIDSDIPLTDKFRWLCSNVLTVRESRLLAIQCAEFTLAVFERKYPNDLRPRKAIQAAKDFLEGNIKIKQLSYATKGAMESASTVSSTNKYLNDPEEWGAWCAARATVLAAKSAESLKQPGRNQCAAAINGAAEAAKKHSEINLQLDNLLKAYILRYYYYYYPSKPTELNVELIKRKKLKKEIINLCSVVILGLVAWKQLGYINKGVSAYEMIKIMYPFYILAVVASTLLLINCCFTKNQEYDK